MSKQSKKQVRIGRPPKDPAQTRTVALKIMFTSTESAELTEWAGRYGMDKAQVIRHALGAAGVISSVAGGPLTEAERATIRAGAARHGLVGGAS